MRNTLLSALTLLVALLAASPARAETFIRLDRADAEAAWLPGFVRLRLYASAVTLEGAFVPVLGDQRFVLELGASKKRIPYLVGQYAGVDEPLGIALVVMTSFDYAEDFPEIRRELGKLIESLPKTAEISVISYADTVHTSSLQSPNRALKKLDSLFPELAPTDNELIEAVKKAIHIVDRVKVKPPHKDARKIIILVSDGKDVDPDPDRYRKVGKKAERKGIRIDSLAYSPEDNRRPLLGLGELSKQSHGTFRWVRQRGLFAGQIKPLASEIADQYVLTFFVPADELAKKKKVALRLGDVESNELRVEPGCGESHCGGGQYCVEAKCVEHATDDGPGILGWVLYIVGGLVGLLLLLAAIGYLLSRRGAPGPLPPPPLAVPGGPGPGVAQPAGESSHRIMAVDSQGNAIGGAAPPPSGAQPAAQPAPVAAGPAAAPRPPAAASPGRQAMLYVVKGPNPGHTIPVSHGFTIGSQPGLHLTLAGDSFASSVHAQILMDTAGNCTIVDKGSTNGTYVNGVRTQRMQLAHGMSIKVGGAELRFLLQ